MHPAPFPSGSWSIAITSSFERSARVKSSIFARSQPMSSGAARSDQSDTCVYCSFGARRDGPPSFQQTFPTQSMSGSFHAPGSV